MVYKPIWDFPQELVRCMDYFSAPPGECVSVGWRELHLKQSPWRFLSPALDINTEITLSWNICTHAHTSLFLWG